MFDTITLAMAFPKAEDERAKLQHITEMAQVPFPPLYGDEEAPCERCGLLLDIGPRVARELNQGAWLLCPACVLALMIPGRSVEFGLADLIREKAASRMTRKP